MFAYSNNGHSYRAMDEDYQVQDGEVLFPDHASPEDLAAAFPGHRWVPGRQRGAAQYRARGRDLHHRQQYHRPQKDS